MDNKISGTSSTSLITAYFKKNFSFFLFLFILVPASYAQVGIGVVTPDPSAILHVQDTARGVLIPRMTEAQKNAINNPATGLLIYQMDQSTAGFWYYNGTQWVNLSAANNGGLHTVVFSDSVTNAQAIAQIVAQVGPNTQEIRINDCINLTSIDLSMLTNIVEIYINNNRSLQTINLSNLQRVEGGFYINLCPSLTTLNIPVLKKIGKSQNGSIGFFMTNSGMTNIVLPMVTLISGTLNISFNPNLQSISCPLYEHIIGMDMSIFYNPVLTSISFPVVKTIGNIFTIQNNHILPSLNFPMLTTLYSMYIANLGSLTTVSLPALTTITQSLTLTRDTGFTSLLVPLLASANGLGVESCNQLVSLSFPSLVTAGGFGLRNNNILSSISVNNVTTAKSLDVSECNSITSVVFPSLVTIDYCSFFRNTGLTSISLNNVNTMTYYLNVRECNNITSLSFPSLATLGSFGITGNTGLSSLSLNSLNAMSGGGSVYGNSLPSAQINTLLSKLVSINPLIANQVFNFKQLTPAPPTGQGLVDKATLIARPNSVITD